MNNLYFFMKHNNISGIYRITSIPTEEIYIGKSKNMGFRWSNHIEELFNKTHHNKRLQELYNEYGRESFKFEVLEKNVQECHLFLREWWWLQNSLIESEVVLINSNVSREYSECWQHIQDNIKEYRDKYKQLSDKDIKIKILEDKDFIRFWYNGDMEWVYRYNIKD